MREEERNNLDATKPVGIDRVWTQLILGLCYFSLFLSLYLLIPFSLIVGAPDIDATFIMFIFISMEIAFIIYSLLGVVFLHIYLRTYRYKEIATFYKWTIGIVLTLIIVVFLTSDK